MKRLFLLILTLCLIAVALPACSPKVSEGTTPSGQAGGQGDGQNGGQTAPDEPDGKKGETDDVIEEIFLTIGSRKICVKLEQNSATDALIELLKQDDIIYTASEYGGFEKVGNLGHTLPRSDKQMTTEAGDVILYLGNQIVLFYGSNSWNYTKLGEVQGVSAEEWKSILTETDPITVKIGLR